MMTTNHLRGIARALWLCLICAPMAWAADTTPPSIPVVADDGTYTTNATQLHATWTSSDVESGIVEFQYLIRQDSTAGTIIVPWTSTGTTPSVTASALSLVSGKMYYLQVKARNGAGLWSAIGSSNGIKVDTSPPGAPGLPAEGASTDLDFNGTGAYSIYWTAPSDPESGIAAYEVQEQVGQSGTWVSLTTTTTSASFSVSGRLDKTFYSYQVRAKNGAGLWGPWSVVSDGILIDKTIPTPIAAVTDDGAILADTTTLHATWTASNDPESGLVQYEYQIRKDSTSGQIIVDWTSLGLALEVTRTGVSLVNGNLYFFAVRAKDGAALYSATKYSDGIRAPDPTAPTAPGQPTEGNPDTAFNGTGSYTVYWAAATDLDSGISAYELQERVGSAGTWTSLTTTISVPSFAVASRLDKTAYYYQVRAKNGVGTWGPFSPVSSGVLIDKTAPTTIATVTDDGATNLSTTTLHATWASSSDPESAIAQYEYLIRQDTTTGTIIVNWTSVGSAREVTRTGLSLINGKMYYVGVRAKNGAGLYSAITYSDGIRVPMDTTPPTGTIAINGGAAATKTTAVTLTLAATDNAGTVAQMAFSTDGTTYAAPEAYATTKPWTLAAGPDGARVIWVKFVDPTGNWSAPVSATILLDTTPPQLSITSPADQSIIGIAAP